MENEFWSGSLENFLLIDTRLYTNTGHPACLGGLNDFKFLRVNSQRDIPRALKCDASDLIGYIIFSIKH